MRPSRHVAIAVAFARTVAIAVAFAVVTAPLGVATAHAGCAIGRAAAASKLADSSPALKRGVAVASVTKSLPDPGPVDASPFARRAPCVASAVQVGSLDPTPVPHAPGFHTATPPRVRGPPNATS